MDTTTTLVHLSWVIHLLWPPSWFSCFHICTKSWTGLQSSLQTAASEHLKNTHCIISPPSITSFKGSLFPWHQTQGPDNGPQMPHPHYLIPDYFTGAIFCHSPSCTPCCSHNDLSPQTHRASRPKAVALA